MPPFRNVIQQLCYQREFINTMTSLREVIIMQCNVFTFPLSPIGLWTFLKDTCISHGSLAAKTNKPQPSQQLNTIKGFISGGIFYLFVCFCTHVIIQWELIGGDLFQCPRFFHAVISSPPRSSESPSSSSAFG